ncbi:MAG: Polysaccharide chain length determinant protein locus subfamily, partial [Noviherbaspirillum sp.]|nr:Polysaccharide chain length determinant protein locus subfamily [Noviherbaspirillum sp.]
MDELIAQLTALLKGVWKYRWYSIAVAFPILIGGGAVVYTLPN